MKLGLWLAALATIATAAPVLAQPPGSYQRQCRNIRMEGQFLHAECRGAYGWAPSSINVMSCGTGIGVDREGGLICGAPGVDPGRPLPPQPYPPDYGRPPSGGYDRFSVTIYDRYSFRGGSMRVDGEQPNLDRTGFNDRVASIKLRRRSGPWLVCEDSNYRGRCVTIEGDVRDVSTYGMLNRISSMRPLYELRPTPR